MKIVVVGGAGQVGSPLVSRLASQGHEVIAASRRTGVDVITGAGLVEVLAGAEVVVDVTNSPSFEDEVAGPFFEIATTRLLAAEAQAGVGRHIALSIVGAERLAASGYFRAKLAQERQVMASGAPFTILRATQFFEFLGAIVHSSVVGEAVRLAPARIQPIAARDVAAALADLVARPADLTIEVAGPDPHRLDQIVQRFMSASGDAREVITDPQALYFGTRLGDETLMAGNTPRFGHTDFETWLRSASARPPPTQSEETKMKLYYSPLACSLADHIALEEAGVAFEREAVDLKTKRTASGRDFSEVTPKAYVPVLVLEDDQVLTENVAVLDWIASQHPHLAVEGPLGRTRMLEALTYVTTELHHGFKPMWHGGSDEEKAKARESLAAKLAYVAGTMRGDYLFGDAPSVADFYLFVMLLWAARFGVSTPPSLSAMAARMKARPAVQRALEQEGLLQAAALSQA